MRKNQLVIQLRRQHRWGAAHIGFEAGLAASTVQSILRSEGLGRLDRGDRATATRPQRYQRDRPGELVHIDVKKLGRIGRPGHRVNGDRRTRTRGIGWEYVHVAIDDATRLSYVEVLDDEKAVTAVGFLRRALAHFAAHGVRVERLMTDNGNAYRSAIHALACKALGIKHLRTRPYRPRTNGKAERFIRTMLSGWAYGAIYHTSDQRRRALAGWLDFYNRRRPHRSLGRQAPIERLQTLNRNNVPGSYT